MRYIPLLPVLALVACANLGTPPPSDVALTNDNLSVRLSNGETCYGPAPAEASGGWSGQLQGCSVAYSYDVAVQPGTNPVRMVLHEIFTAIGLEGALVPLATVTIDDGAGRDWRFATPERVQN